MNELKKDDNGNSGYRNTGNYNSGNRNSGDCNSGDCNSGYGNSGNWNSGYANSGDCNSGSRNSGFFNAKTPNVRLFDKETTLSFEEFHNSKAYAILMKIPPLTRWIPEREMTEQEKQENESYQATAGYIKTYTLQECYATWWAELTAEEKEIIQQIPNFDASIFKEITGIDVEEVVR